jgi:RNA polymerase sigma-70 factor (ECF subfamily)
LNDEEAELVAGCIAGSAGAQRQLHDALAGRVTAYFLRSGFIAADAADLAQETFMRAVKGLPTFDADRGSLRAWIGAIARNVARRHFARRKEAESFDPALADEMFAAPPDPGRSPEAREETAAVDDCVASLPPLLGWIVRLRYVDGLTTRAMADVADLPEATIRLRLAEAKGLIERCLKSKGILD